MAVEQKVEPKSEDKKEEAKPEEKKDETKPEEKKEENTKIIQILLNQIILKKLQLLPQLQQMSLMKQVPQYKNKKKKFVIKKNYLDNKLQIN